MECSFKNTIIVFLVNGYNAAVLFFDFAIGFGLIFFLVRSGNLSLTSEGRWVAGGLLILFVLMLFEVAGSAYDGVRILVAANLIIPAFLYFQPKNRLVQLLPAITFSVIALVNIGTTARVWLFFSPEFAALKSSFALIRPGAFVLIAKHDQPSDLTELPLHHAPVLAVHYAGAFVPSLWSIPGMYVVQPNPALGTRKIPDSIHNDAGLKGPVPFRMLEAVADGQVPSGLPSLFVVGRMILTTSI